MSETNATLIAALLREGAEHQRCRRSLSRLIDAVTDAINTVGAQLTYAGAEDVSHALSDARMTLDPDAEMAAYHATPEYVAAEAERVRYEAAHPEIFGSGAGDQGVDEVD